MPGDMVEHEKTPVPDPTILTTEALQREVVSIKELVDFRIDAVKDMILSQGHFFGKQLELIERARVEGKGDGEKALAAALSAAKDAVREQTIASERSIAKSDNSTSKQLEQLGSTFSAAVAGLTTSLGDVKERVGRIEQIKTGGQQATAGYAAAIAAAASIVAVVGTIIAIVVALRGGG